MSAVKLHLVSPEPVTDYVRDGRVHSAFQVVAGLAGTELVVDDPSQCDTCEAPVPHDQTQAPILYRGKRMGHLQYDSQANDPAVACAAGAMSSMIEHALEREMAVSDLADALMTGYEELNLLYALLPSIATKVLPTEIGEVLVAETAHTLGCRRVSLLALDEKRENYRVLASRGLPKEVHGVSIPICDSIAARALWEDDLLVVEDISAHPDLKALSRGHYESGSFAVVRVPLQAHGEALGFLTATERTGDKEFTARDRKLLEGLSAMGASALLNCRLHAAVNKQMMSTIHALASAVDAKDHYTHDHAGRVARLCVATARELGIADAIQLREVELAGLLHDIGKIGIPDAILTKPAELAFDEYSKIQKHVEIGARIVEHVPGLAGVAKAIHHHHERYDGLGYPKGITGDAIPLASKLIAVVDTFDALTSERPYRNAVGVQAALKELNRCKGTQFDPAVVDAFTAVAKSNLELTTPMPALSPLP